VLAECDRNAHRIGVDLVFRRRNGGGGGRDLPRIALLSSRFQRLKGVREVINSAQWFVSTEYAVGCRSTLKIIASILRGRTSLEAS
jgi:hypothetical protein